MDLHHAPWNLIFWSAVKMLKTFGLIPGAMAAYGLRRVYQKHRQNRAMEGWPGTEATIHSGKVHFEGGRRWVEITYTYFVGEYRSGTYVRKFRQEEQADDFIRQLKDKRVQVRYKDSDPNTSVLLDRDLEMIVLLEPQLR